MSQNRSTIDWREITPADFAKLTPDQVQQGLPTVLDKESVRVLMLLRQHPHFFCPMPTDLITNVPDGFQIALTHIPVKESEFWNVLKPVKDERGNWTKVSQGYYPLKVIWKKLASVSGFQWLFQYCHVTKREVDLNGRLMFISYQAVCEGLTLSGQTKQGVGHKSLDFGNPRPEWGEKQIAAKRADALPIVQTGAEIRAFVDATGIPMLYEKSALEKIWVMPSLVLKIDTTDPEQRRMITTVGLVSRNLLYNRAAADAAASNLLPEAPDSPQLIEDAINGDAVKPAAPRATDDRRHQAPFESGDSAEAKPAGDGQRGSDPSPSSGRRRQQTDGWQKLKVSGPVGDCRVCREEIKPSDSHYWHHAVNKLTICQRCEKSVPQTVRDAAREGVQS